MEKITIAHPAENCHWYGVDGSPQYERIGENGKPRSTTLRDARKENLYPSVTTILKIADRPGLKKWIQNQVLIAALTLPRLDNEPEQAWLARVLEDSSQHAKQAAEFGTQVHAAVQGFYEGVTVPDNMIPYTLPTIQEIAIKYGTPDWTAERSFAHPLKFGGKVDLSAPGIVIDFKTKAFKSEDIKKGLSYDEHIMQIAAYRVGIGMEGATCSNVFISTTNPGLVHIEEYNPDELYRSWEMFRHLLMFWKLKNKFI